MSNVTVNFEKSLGRIKPMHAVNNGPVGSMDPAQERGNFADFASLAIPFVRNHDASFCASYGGEHTVDVHAIFPDFSADPYDPASYDFALTDDYTQSIIDAGSEVFYRLGSKIEHARKKYGTIPPADPKKWAVICEHIIRHYNEGWADGFHHGIHYFEIWNEPDGVKPDGDTPNWSGTPEQFFELYCVTATHLKACFPELKIGGPAMSWMQPDWMRGFLGALTENGRHVPLDFFSWHCYTTDPKLFSETAAEAREWMDNAGYTDTELVLDEWNYMNWGKAFLSSVEAIIGMRGAAFAAASMIEAQHSPMHIFMYYDARPCAFNGLFDFYTYRPLKGFCAFRAFSALYQLGNETESVSDDSDVYVTAAASEAGRALMIVHYNKDGEVPGKTIRIDGLPDGELTFELTDSKSSAEVRTLHVVNGFAELTLPCDSIALIRI